MMFTPWGPSAVPTGGAGVAAPACSCTLTSAAIFFLGGILLLSLVVMTRGCSALCHLSQVSIPGDRGFETRHAVLRFAQTRWIWLKLSSTGVSRPKISTRALTLWDSALISVIVA